MFVLMLINQKIDLNFLCIVDEHQSIHHNKNIKEEHKVISMVGFTDYIQGVHLNWGLGAFAYQLHSSCSSGEL